MASSLFSSTFLSVFNEVFLSPFVGDSVSVSPFDLNLIDFYDGSVTSSISTGTGGVSAIADISGNGGPSLTQGNTTARPQTGTRAVNGLNVLDFDGVNDTLGASADLSPTVAQPHTLFAVVVIDVIPGFGWVIDARDGNRALRLGSTGADVDTWGSSVGFSPELDGSGTPATIGVVQVLTAVYDGANSELYLDGVLIDTGTLTIANYTGMELFNRFNSTQFINGAFCEAYTAVGNASTIDIAAQVTALQSKWIYSVAGISSPVFHLDASISSSITESGGLVSKWADLSSANASGTQGTDGNKPTTDTRTLNSLNAIDWDGNDSMAVPDIVFDGDFTIAGVAQFDVSTTFNLFLGRAGFTNVFIGINSSNEMVVDLIGTSTESTNTIADGVPFYYVITRVGTTLTINYNGTKTIDVAQSGAAQTFNLFGRFQNNLNFNGTLPENVYFSRAVSSQEETDLVNYLTAKWIA